MSSAHLYAAIVSTVQPHGQSSSIVPRHMFSTNNLCESLSPRAREPTSQQEGSWGAGPRVRHVTRDQAHACAQFCLHDRNRSERQAMQVKDMGESVKVDSDLRFARALSHCFLWSQVIICRLHYVTSCVLQAAV